MKKVEEWIIFLKKPKKLRERVDQGVQNPLSLVMSLEVTMNPFCFLNGQTLSPGVDN